MSQPQQQVPSSSNPLVVYNLTDGQLLILGVALNSGTSYIIPSANVVTWCKNAKLRILCRGNQCSIMVYGTPLSENQAADWLNSVSKGDIVYDL